MELRRNIILSIVLHAVIITAVFTINMKDRTSPVKIDFMVVALLEKLSEATPKHLSPINKSGEGERINELAGNLPSPPFTKGGLGGLPGRNREPQPDQKVISTKKDSSASPQNDITYHSFANIISENNRGNIENNPAESPPATLFQREAGGYSENSFNKERAHTFLDLIRAAIEKAKDYPFLARKKRIEGTVITGFIINSKGYPEDLRVEKGSGSEILDSAAIKIVKRAAPFPRVNGKIVVPITFKLTDSTSSH